MDRQTIIAFVLISLILMVWLYMSTPQQSQQQQNQKAQATKTEQGKTVAETAPKQSKEIVSEKPAVDTSWTSREFPSRTSPERIITVENEVARFEMTSIGGKLKKIYLKKYKNWRALTGQNANGENYLQDVQLLNFSRGSSLDIEFLTAEGKKVSTGDLSFQTDASNHFYKLAANDSLVIPFTFLTAGNKTITKKFTFYGNKYAARVDLEIQNFKNTLAQNSIDVTWNSGIRFVELNSVDEAIYANASVYYGGEQVKVDVSNDPVSKEFNGRVDWLCIRNKYFATIIAPNQPEHAEGAFIKGNLYYYQNHGMRENYAGRYKFPVKDDHFKTSLLVYTGPVNYDLLKEYNRHFESIVDFGSFFGLSFVVRPIAEYVFLPLFNFLHMFISNFGIVIIIFSIIVKILLHPLTRKSNLSMQKMQLLQPKITELKEKYKDDPTKQNKETMKLYSTYGINPMGGCLPMILQMPVFIALWGLFQTAIELRQQPFFGWIHDLSRPDVIAELPFRIPIFGVNEISLLALLMGITMFVQQKMTIKDPQQKALIYIMPVMLTFLFMSFPSGLNLYYFCFNVLSIGQQYYLTHHTTNVVLEPVKQTNKKKGFMERMMEMAEEKAKQQSQAKKKK